MKNEKREREREREREKCYITKIFTTLLQQILSSMLLQAIIDGKNIILVVGSNYN